MARCHAARQIGVGVLITPARLPEQSSHFSRYFSFLPDDSTETGSVQDGAVFLSKPSFATDMFCISFIFIYINTQSYIYICFYTHKYMLKRTRSYVSLRDFDGRDFTQKKTPSESSQACWIKADTTSRTVCCWGWIGRPSSSHVSLMKDACIGI